MRITITNSKPRTRPYIGQVKRLKTCVKVRDVQRTKEGYWIRNARGYRYEWITPEQFMESNGYLPEELRESNKEL